MEKREIKFRGKRIDNGDWFYGNLDQFKHMDGKKFIDVYTISGQNHDSFIHEVDPETIGQFIGVHALRFEKIFEDDGVECCGYLIFLVMHIYVATE